MGQTLCAALIAPENAEPNAWMIRAMLGEETTTATSATVTIAPKMLNAFSPTGLPLAVFPVHVDF
jgi:hypothetical protein